MLDIASEKGSYKKKYFVWNRFCRIQGASVCAKRMHIRPTGRPTRHNFHELACIPLSTSWFPPMAGSIFRKKGKMLCKKRAIEVCQAQRKEQIVYESDKIAATMHTLIFADRALGAKNAKDCSQKQYFEEGMERKNGDRNGHKSEMSKSNDKKCFYRGRFGVKKAKL